MSREQESNQPGPSARKETAVQSSTIQTRGLSLKIVAVSAAAALFAAAGFVVLRSVTNGGEPDTARPTMTSDQRNVERENSDHQAPAITERSLRRNDAPSGARPDGSPDRELVDVADDTFYATGTCYGDRVNSQVKMAPVNQIFAYNTFYLGSGWQRGAYDLKLFKWQPVTPTWVFVDHSGRIETSTTYLSEPVHPTEYYYFRFPSVGYYKVAVELFWYADAGHRSAYQYAWVTHHDASAFWSPDRDYCTYLG